MHPDGGSRHGCEGAPDDYGAQRSGGHNESIQSCGSGAAEERDQKDGKCDIGIVQEHLQAAGASFFWKR